MNRNTYYTLQNTLFYNSWLSSQVFKIDSQDNLQIVELSPLKSRNETIPLDLIDAEPKLSSTLDRQLITFSLLSAVISFTFLLSTIFIVQIWAIPFSILFLLTSITTAYSSYKNKTIIYTYQFLDSNTRLFTLYESFTGNKQVEMFVHKLNERISLLNNEENNTIDENFETENKSSSYNEANYSQFTRHLDFLFNHGAINDALYSRVENKIYEIVYGVTSEKTPTNIIYFPSKAS